MLLEPTNTLNSELMGRECGSNQFAKTEHTARKCSGEKLADWLLCSSVFSNRFFIKFKEQYLRQLDGWNGIGLGMNTAQTDNSVGNALE